jgi:hypothetical protein
MITPAEILEVRNWRLEVEKQEEASKRQPHPFCTNRRKDGPHKRSQRIEGGHPPAHPSLSIL